MFPVATPVVNALPIDFAIVTSAMTSIDEIWFYDAISGGTVQHKWILNTPVSVAANGFLHIGAGTMTATGT
jgi:hypothetical protein